MSFYSKFVPIIIKENPEHFARILIIFQGLHDRDKYSGTGIGLAVCMKIVERQRDQIWVESEEGKGTILYFTIPLIYSISGLENQLFKIKSPRIAFY